MKLSELIAQIEILKSQNHYLSNQLTSQMCKSDPHSIIRNLSKEFDMKCSESSHEKIPKKKWELDALLMKQ